MTSTTTKNVLPHLLAGGLSLGTALGVSSVMAENAQPSPQRHHVLFIAVDDLKPMLGCYGDTRIQTPNIDRLAARGVAFQSAYCQQAVCAPSRNTVFTGLRPQTLGIYDLKTYFRTKAPDVVTLPQAFMQAGYRTEAIGKLYHTAHGNSDDAASWSVPRWPSGGLQYALEANRAPNIPEGKRGPSVEAAVVSDETYIDGSVARRAADRLEALRDQAEPFFLAVGFVRPHLPFTAPKRYWDLYQREQFTLDARQTPPIGAPAYAPTNWSELRHYSDIPKAGPLPDDKARELIHGYHAAVSYMDAQVGLVLDKLDQLQLTDKTIIVLWGDHGFHLGDHGQWCKHSNYEQAVRVPLIISAPGNKAAGSTPAGLVELVDIYPTLIQWCGITTPTSLEGASLVPMLHDASHPGKPAAFHLYPRAIPGHVQGMGRAIRTDRYRLVEWSVADKADFREYELYDYQSNPDETINHAGDPQYAAVMLELKKQLHAHFAPTAQPVP